jgi:hypothetical protein
MSDPLDHFRRSGLSVAEVDGLKAENARLLALISRPYIGAWTDEILVEAAHQRDRWGADQDHGKAPEDWFWLIGYLAGKALASHKAGDLAKAHHHTVSTAAVLAHWAATIDGNENVFRPGLGVEKIAAVSPSSRESADAK